MQGIHRRGSASHPIARAAAAASAVLTMTGALVVVADVAPAHATTPAALTLTQTWIQDLNDAPCGVAIASPVEANFDGAPAVEVGDRSGQLYGFHIANPVAGAPTPATNWASTPVAAPVGSGEGCGISGIDNGEPAVGVNGVTVPGDPPIDSTASTIAGANGTSTLYFDAGNAAEPVTGGYYAYNPNGTELWNQVVTNPATDTTPDDGVQASPSVGQAGGSTFVNAGALGQETYSLNANNGASMPGWPQFTADSVFSTAAVGDLYGTGQDDLVVGGASTAGEAYGTHYDNGGHLRVFNAHGGLICQDNTSEEIDSSPAVGPILSGGGLGIAVGTGSYFHGSDQDTVKVLDSQCNQVWSRTLNGTTGGSPALADVLGNGQLAVVEGTSAGTVYALNAATGATLWSTTVPGEILGSLTTADLAGNGTQDVIAATTQGLDILDGATGAPVADVDDGNTASNTAAGVTPAASVYGFQNAPLVTADPDGSIGITVAGYFGIANSPFNHDAQGMVQHFTVGGSAAANAGAAGGWPQFHHDPSLSGFTGTPSSQLAACTRPPAANAGYLSVASDGGVFAFGQPFCGSTGALHLNKPVVGMAQVPGHGGYWLVASDGGVFTFGSVAFYGSTGALTLNKPIIGMAATPDGQGYWLAAADGGIFAFGDAQFYGSAAAVPGLNVVGMAASPDGQGYWEVTSNGQVFSFGDAAFAGDARTYHLNAPIVGITPDPTSGGYWLVGSDGGIFSFGAPFFGSTGNIHLNQPVVGMQSTDDGDGYWFVAADGGIFSYGDAPFMGSTGNIHLNRPVVGMVGF